MIDEKIVNRLLRTNLHIFVTGSNAKLLSGELATHLTGRYNEIHLFASPDLGDAITRLGRN